MLNQTRDQVKRFVQKEIDHPLEYFVGFGTDWPAILSLRSTATQIVVSIDYHNLI